MQDNNTIICDYCKRELPSETAECAHCAPKLDKGELYQPLSFSFRKLWRDVSIGLLVVAAIIYVLTASREEIAQDLFEVVLMTLYTLFVSLFLLLATWGLEKPYSLSF